VDGRDPSIRHVVGYADVELRFEGSGDLLGEEPAECPSARVYPDSSWLSYQPRVTAW
jgi:hypothetical protein